MTLLGISGGEQWIWGEWEDSGNSVFLERMPAQRQASGIEHTRMHAQLLLTPNYS